MNQQEFDFNKDVNEPSFTAEESFLIDKIVSSYETKKLITKNETIIIQIFFEEHCIEISKRLKSLGFFKGEWNFEEDSFGFYFHSFISNSLAFYNSTLSEFLILFLGKLSEKIKAIDFQKNSINEFSLDRKITEEILQHICNGDIQNAILLFIPYMKIWNQFKIYNNPFNNNKGLLICRIFSEKVWPRDQISYEAYNKFEISVQDIINNISNQNIYVPFFDKKERVDYSVSYLKERDKLMKRIEKLFAFDLTDEMEPYYCLIEDILSQPSENDYKKVLIRNKVEKQMLPSPKDVKMFIKLYESPTEKEFGKWLLSKFYLFSYLNY